MDELVAPTFVPVVHEELELAPTLRLIAPQGLSLDGWANALKIIENEVARVKRDFLTS
jgi:hypothetical protein